MGEGEREEGKWSGEGGERAFMEEGERAVAGDWVLFEEENREGLEGDRAVAGGGVENLRGAILEEGARGERIVREERRGAGGELEEEYVGDLGGDRGERMVREERRGWVEGGGELVGAGWGIERPGERGERMVRED